MALTGRRPVLAAAGAVVAAVAVVLVVQSRDGGEAPGARPASTVPLEAPVAVDPGRDEALALIRKGENATYHARYEASAGAGEGFPRSVEVWRRPGSARTDTEYAAAGRVERSASIRGAAGTVSCLRVNEEPWSCRRVDVAADEVFAQAAADLAGARVAARDGEVRGRAARCFAVDDGEAVELCFDGDGVLLRLAVGEASLELVTKEETVDSSATVPPAEPAD